MAVTRIPIPAWARTQKADNRLELSLAEIYLSIRTVNCLEEDNIFTVQDLLQCTRERLLAIPNLGEKTIDVLYAALEKIGYCRSPKPSLEQGRTVYDFALLQE